MIYNQLMVAQATTALDRVLGGLAKSMTIDVAEQITHLKLDAETQAHLDQLADKAATGQSLRS